MLFERKKLMYIDFHTHGKLAKYLPFSTAYTHSLFREARLSGLDAVCLTEHFNTEQFDELYRYIKSNSERDGDSLIFENLRIFAGMETDIAEGGHVLCLGTPEEILELNRQLTPYKKKGDFLPFERLLELFREYSVIIGAAHPFRDGGHIPELDSRLLSGFDFIDLNGKDVAEDRTRTLRLTYALGERLKIPVVCGSDTHQTVQYGAVKTKFYEEINTVAALCQAMEDERYKIEIAPDIEFKVRTAKLMKKALKEIHALGGKYDFFNE